MSRNDRNDDQRRDDNVWIAVIFVICIGFGYQVGKDMAKRDNARDAAAQSSAATPAPSAGVPR